MLLNIVTDGELLPSPACLTIKERTAVISTGCIAPNYEK